MEKYGRVGRALYPILADKRMDVGVKKVIFESTLTPVLLNRTEIWSTTRDESRIQAEEMRGLRLKVGRTRKEKIRNERIRESRGRTNNSKDRYRKTEIVGPCVEDAGGERCQIKVKVEAKRKKTKRETKERWMKIVGDSLRRHQLSTV